MCLMIDVEEEKSRLDSLISYNILDTEPESPYNSVAWLASYICQTPIALISFLDDHRQWIKAKIGTELSSIPKEESFCKYTIESEGLVEVADMSADLKYAGLPSVKSAPSLKFYAGVPLVSHDGYKIGTICVVDYVAKTLSDQQKEALAILASEVVTNLETRKNNSVLLDLLEKAQKFHHLFNNSSELHCITDSEGKVAFVNTSVTELLGFSADEVLGKTIWDFCVPGERDRIMPSVYEKISSGEKRFQVETLVRTKDGRERWFEWADVIMEGYWLVNGRDITERKFFEQRLKRLSLAVEKSPAGVIIRSEENRVVWMNEACEKLIGFSLPELEGKEMGSLLIGPKTDLSVLNGAQKALAERVPYEIEILLYKKDRTPIWLFLCNNPLLDSQGNLESQITIALDITAKKEAEFQMLKSQKDAIELSKSKELFLSVMSHEMRTPLNAVIGMTRLLAEEDPLQRQVENLNILSFSAENLLALINDVLDFTKIETGNLQLEEVAVNLQDLVSKTIESLKFKSGENHIDIRYSIDERIPNEIISDPTRLYQIFMNLLGNAVKFTHEGYVQLQAQLVKELSEGVMIEFIVEDTGIGIAEEKLKTIFDAYSQAETNTSRKYGGTGLGLSITKKLIELFGSRIEVESVFNEGTKFRFTISFRAPKTGNRVLELDQLKEEPIDARILIVDDNAINRLLAKKVLEKWSIITDFAENGQQAVDKIRNEEYDLVLMDIHMPVMSGEEAVRIIRNTGIEKLRKLPILALTGSAQREDSERFKMSGLNDFVVKPFEPKLLYRKIRQHLEQSDSIDV